MLEFSKEWLLLFASCTLGGLHHHNTVSCFYPKPSHPKPSFPNVHKFDLFVNGLMQLGGTTGGQSGSTALPLSCVVPAVLPVLHERFYRSCLYLYHWPVLPAFGSSTTAASGVEVPPSNTG